MSERDVLWRAKATVALSRSYLDEWDEVRTYPLVTPEVSVYYLDYPVIRRTPKGAWIDDGIDRKFVLLTAHKRFACNTKEEARESLIARTKRRIAILTAQQRGAEALLTHLTEENT